MYSYMDFVWFLCIDNELLYWTQNVSWNEVGKLGGLIFHGAVLDEILDERKASQNRLAALDRRILYPDTYIIISLSDVPYT